MPRVYVVAWHYDGGGGFDWYRHKEVADNKFEEEKAVCHELAHENWTAYRFDADVSSYSNATDEIDAELDYYCDEAWRSYNANEINQRSG